MDINSPDYYEQVLLRDRKFATRLLNFFIRIFRAIKIR